MNPPSLREVCQAATPGPWHPGPFSGRVIMAGETRIGEANVPNARLIARFSPATALAVYEALEGVLRVADRKTSEFDAVRKALNLLDGRTEP